MEKRIVFSLSQLNIDKFCVFGAQLNNTTLEQQQRMVQMWLDFELFFYFVCDFARMIFKILPLAWSSWVDVSFPFSTIKIETFACTLFIVLCVYITKMISIDNNSFRFYYHLKKLVKDIHGIDKACADTHTHTYQIAQNHISLWVSRFFSESLKECLCVVVLLRCLHGILIVYLKCERCYDK